MSNSCYNYITINGSVEDIKDFKKLLELEESKDQKNNLERN